MLEITGIIIIWIIVQVLTCGIKCIICKHEYKIKRKYDGSQCYILECEKCGKTKTVSYDDFEKRRY